METGMNTTESHVIYLLNCLMKSYLWHIANHDSLTLVYMLKLTVIEFEEKFSIKTHDNVKHFLSEDCQKTGK